MPTPQLTKIRLFLVDDQPIILEGISETVGSLGGIQIIGEAKDGRSAIRKAKALRPDVILLDIGLPDISGLEVFRELRPMLPGTKFLILTVHGNHEYRSYFQSQGAHGYIIKNIKPTLLAKVIKRAYANETYFPELPSEKPITIPFYPTLPQKSKAGEKISSEFGMTKTEQQVAVLLTRGLTPNHIARKTNVSYHTVHTHLKHIYKKLGVRNKGEAMAKLLHLPPPIN